MELCPTIEVGMEMMNSLRFGMWFSCLAINILGLVVVLRAGTAPAAVYAAFVSATLALNRPRVNVRGLVSAVQTSRPAVLLQWLWARVPGRR